MIDKMNWPRGISVMAVAAMALAGCGGAPGPGNDRSTGGPADWRQKLREAIPVYGHRNWIVVADSAYPAQSSPGIETVVSGEDHFVVLQEVLAAVAASKHLRPLILLDRELEFVPEADAAGVTAFRERLTQVLAAGERQAVDHEQIIARLDQAGQSFHVLLIKTNLTIPYTSVFLQLDCGYWGAGAEARMREAMRSAAKR